MIVRSWRGNWARIVPMFGYPSEIRRAIYTTNTIESLNMTLRKINKNRSLFSNDEAVFKLMYLGLRNISKRWTLPIRNWSAALNQFAILFEGRVPMGALANSLTQKEVAAALWTSKRPPQASGSGGAHHQGRKTLLGNE